VVGTQPGGRSPGWDDDALRRGRDDGWMAERGKMMLNEAKAGDRVIALVGAG
jgi:hypothetical protein